MAPSGQHRVAPSAARVGPALAPVAANTKPRSPALPPRSRPERTRPRCARIGHGSHGTGIFRTPTAVRRVHLQPHTAAASPGSTTSTSPSACPRRRDPPRIPRPPIAPTGQRPTGPPSLPSHRLPCPCIAFPAVREASITVRHHGSPWLPTALPRSPAAPYEATTRPIRRGFPGLCAPFPASHVLGPVAPRRKPLPQAYTVIRLMALDGQRVALARKCGPDVILAVATKIPEETRRARSRPQSVGSRQTPMPEARARASADSGMAGDDPFHDQFDALRRRPKKNRRIRHAEHAASDRQHG